jgi:hypothetical protein
MIFAIDLVREQNIALKASYPSSLTVTNQLELFYAQITMMLFNPFKDRVAYSKKE